MCREQNAKKKVWELRAETLNHEEFLSIVLGTGVEIAKWYSKVERTKL